MISVKLAVGAILSLAVLNVTMAQELTYDERCQVLEGNGVRVDQCDAKKLLACKDGRCQCSDPANQIYTYRNEPVSPSRSKRSPGKKGSGFKKIAVGAVAGVATYQVAKSAGKAFNNGFTTTPPPPKYHKIFACYSRVGGQCALNYNNVESVSVVTTSTTTAAPSVNATTGNDTTTIATPDNSTSTTTTAPVAAALTSLDISKIPKCVQNAVCKPSSPSGTGTSGFLQKVDHDPRVGQCECEEGYKRNSKDLCIKVSSGTDKTGAATAVILASLMVNRFLA